MVFLVECRLCHFLLRLYRQCCNPIRLFFGVQLFGVQSFSDEGSPKSEEDLLLLVRRLFFLLFLTIW